MTKTVVKSAQPCAGSAQKSNTDSCSLGGIRGCTRLHSLHKTGSIRLMRLPTARHHATTCAVWIGFVQAVCSLKDRDCTANPRTL
jgi:hypothetical protein